MGVANTPDAVTEKRRLVFGVGENDGVDIKVVVVVVVVVVESPVVETR